MIIGKSRIGIRPGIGLVTAEELITLYTSANILGHYELAALPTSAYIALHEQELATLLTSAFVTTRITLDALLTSAEILQGKILKTSANIMYRYELAALLTSAYIALHEQELAALLTSATIAQRNELTALPTSANIMLRHYATLETSAWIALHEQTLSALLTSAMIVSRYTLAALLTSAWVALHEQVLATLKTSADIILRLQLPSLPTSAVIFDNRYYALKTSAEVIIPLKNRVYEEKTRGFDLRTTEQRLKQRRRIELFDDGIEAPIIEFEAIFPSQTEKDTFQKAVNNDSENLQYYRGRSDRYHRVRRVGLEPGADESWRHNWSSKIKLLLEDPYLYHEYAQEYNPGLSLLPKTSQDFTNFGTAAAPVLFSIGDGGYGGAQLQNVYVKLLNGATEERSLFISTQLLANEYVDLELEGVEKYYLTHRYYDDFSTADYWPVDAVQVGCTLAGGVVSVPADAYFTYLFKGNILKENIKLTALITKIGSPLIQISTDGINFTTSIPSSEIISEKETVYYLTGTKSKSDIYVRFYSPTGSSMIVSSVELDLKRDISSQYTEIPIIQPDASRAIKIDGSGSGRARILYVSFRSRWHP